MHVVFASIDWSPLAWAFLGICAAAGLLAVVAPRRFAALTQHSNHWVDTDKILATLDKKYDVDRYILPHSRIFGVIVLLGVAVLTAFVWHYFN